MWRLTTLLVASLVLVSSQIQKDEIGEFKQAIDKLAKTGQTADLKKIGKSLHLEHFFRDQFVPQLKDEVLCELCDVVADEAIQLIRDEAFERDQLVEFIADACFVLGVEPYDVCEGVIDLNVDTVLYIAQNKKDLTGANFCASILQKYNCTSDDDNYTWETEIPAGYSAERDPPSAEAGTIHIAQISDFHYDPLYTPGKQAVCAEPLCCQSDQKDAEDGEEECGYWTGYYQADTPTHLVDEVIRHVNEHGVSYVYYTGDIISHRVWSTSIENNTRDIKYIYGKLRDGFDVPVFPILGNHEPSPLNLFSNNVSESSNLTTSWLYDLVAEEWSSWLPEEAQITIKLGGFYTVAPRPGFRIVVLNSNVCYNFNWWLVWDAKDPYGQLEWLVSVLKDAELNQESVHILTHVPSGSSSCLATWAKNYNRIISRFAHTITGIFTGHTHTDEWQIYYNQTEEIQPVNVAYNGASVTPYSDSNPSYKMIHINNETFGLKNICEWTFNLTEANLAPTETPNWYELYNFKGAYEVDSLQAEDIHKLALRMAANQTLINQFDNFYYRNSDVVNARECTEECQKKILCMISVTQYGDNTVCDQLLDIYDEAFNKQQL